MQPYRTFEHTADIGLEAEGATLEAAFANAARGMFAIIVNDRPIEAREERMVTLPMVDDLDQLVVDWLSELLYLHDVEGLVFGDFTLTITDELRAVVRGEPYNRAKHGYGTEIKAVTYHLLNIKRTKKGVFIRVLFDV